MKAGERRSEQHQLQSQMQTAPFVRPSDRMGKDPSDMSMGDFAPKRFALKYEPVPMIVLEYLVPSTGKLYHHKMKLRNLAGDSDPDEMLQYLEKRHPLYFLQRKLSKPQIKNLVKKLIYRVGQMKPKKTASDPVKQPAVSQLAKPSEQKDSSIFTQNKRQHLRDLENKAREKENEIKASSAEKKGGLSSLAGAPSFKTGGQLPSISDDLPPVGENKSKAKVKFDDDFESGSEVSSAHEANNDEEDDDGDFDANELLNMQDYQKKRQQQQMGAGLGRDKENPLPSLGAPPAKPVSKAQPPAERSVLGAQAVAGADEAFDLSGQESFESDEEDEDEEEEKKLAAAIDFSNFDYKTKDLNKLTNAELKAHKANMEHGFQKNAVKKGDPSFVYDKRVNFNRDPEQAMDNSWDESEDEGVEIVAASRAMNNPAGGRTEFTELEDNEYFDDDFDDDFT